MAKNEHDGLQAPALRLRRRLDAEGGETSFEVCSLLDEFGRKNLTAGARRMVAEALAAAGIEAEPPLESVNRGETVTLRLAHEGEGELDPVAADPVLAEEPFAGGEPAALEAFSAAHAEPSPHERLSVGAASGDPGWTEPPSLSVERQEPGWPEPLPGGEDAAGAADDSFASDEPPAGNGAADLQVEPWDPAPAASSSGDRELGEEPPDDSGHASEAESPEPDRAVVPDPEEAQLDEFSPASEPADPAAAEPDGPVPPALEPLEAPEPDERIEAQPAAGDAGVDPPAGAHAAGARGRGRRSKPLPRGRAGALAALLAATLAAGVAYVALRDSGPQSGAPQQDYAAQVQAAISRQDLPTAASLLRTAEAQGMDTPALDAARERLAALQAQESRYADALRAYEEQRYEEAIAGLTALGAYRDAAKRARSMRLPAARALLGEAALQVDFDPHLALRLARRASRLAPLPEARSIGRAARRAIARARHEQRSAENPLG